MFIRFQYYKGLIDMLDYDMLCELKKDIETDVLEDRLNSFLAIKLLNEISNSQYSNKEVE